MYELALLMKLRGRNENDEQRSQIGIRIVNLSQASLYTHVWLVLMIGIEDGSTSQNNQVCKGV